MENMFLSDNTMLSEDARDDEVLQLAENENVEQDQKEPVDNEFAKKRALLQKTKIVR